MHLFGWIAALLFGILMGGPHTLLEQLQDAGIPQNSFSDAELNQQVDCDWAIKDQVIYFVYIRINGEALTGNPEVVRYSANDKTLLRAELKPNDTNLCCGSPEGIDIVDDFLLLSFHFNPSVASVLVLNRKLELVETLYGFDMERVAPNQVVFTENMVHFADVHQGRLQLVDLGNGSSLEIYPLKNDSVRNQFEKELSTRTPKICTEERDLCDAGSFNEGCNFLGGDGKGMFALTCGRSASYLAKEGEEPVTYDSDNAIYIYARNSKGWSHCEQTISEDEAQMLAKRQYRRDSQDRGYDSVKTRCIPNLPIVPDMSTSDSSPFPAPSHSAK